MEKSIALGGSSTKSGAASNPNPRSRGKERVEENSTFSRKKGRVEFEGIAAPNYCVYQEHLSRVINNQNPCCDINYQVPLISVDNHPQIHYSTNPTIVMPSYNPIADHWSQEEQDLFLLGFMKYGSRNWEQISKQFVKTKDPKQVQDYGIHLLESLPLQNFYSATRLTATDTAAVPPTSTNLTLSIPATRIANEQRALNHFAGSSSSSNSIQKSTELDLELRLGLPAVIPSTCFEENGVDIGLHL